MKNTVMKYIESEISNLNLDNDEYYEKISIISETDEAKEIIKIKNKQKKKKQMMDHLGLYGRISTESYWVTRGWGKENYLNTSKKILRKR